MILLLVGHQFLVNKMAIKQLHYLELNLNDVRDLVRLIRENRVLVVFSNSKLPFSYLIRCRTNSRWSHCGVLLPDGSAIESAAMKGGVIRGSLEAFKERASDYAVAEYICNGPIAFFNFFIAQVGKKYDYTGLIGYQTKNRDFQEDDAWFCSEKTETGFIKGSSGHFSNGKNLVSPEDIWQCREKTLLINYA